MVEKIENKLVEVKRGSPMTKVPAKKNGFILVGYYPRVFLQNKLLLKPSLGGRGYLPLSWGPG